jgi:hypothetical protein
VHLELSYPENSAAARAWRIGNSANIIVLEYSGGTGDLINPVNARAHDVVLILAKRPPLRLDDLPEIP